MFRFSSEDEYQQLSEGGVRFLFALDHFEFHDTLDEQDEPHHFVVAAGEGEEEVELYRVDRVGMYECMARFLAGEYEKAEYGMERSPAHDALLDLLELATARARGGDGDFSLLELEENEPADEAEEEHRGP